jgi:hypothetical protein
MTRPTVLLALAVLTGCGEGTKASTGRTQRESDSVVANSQLPGASTAKKAMDISDSSRARVAAQDSAAQ